MLSPETRPPTPLHRFYLWINEKLYNMLMKDEAGRKIVRKESEKAIKQIVNENPDAFPGLTSGRQIETTLIPDEDQPEGSYSWDYVAPGNHDPYRDDDEYQLLS